MPPLVRIGAVSDFQTRPSVLVFSLKEQPSEKVQYPWRLTEACGGKAAPDYVVRERDCAYGEALVRRLRAMGIRDRPTAPQLPWQNAYAERLIGSIGERCSTTSFCLANGTFGTYCDRT